MPCFLFETQSIFRAAQAATLPPVTEALDIMALTSKAAELFLQQSAAEQRRLLHLVLREATWKAGELRISLREPFEQPRLSNSASQANDGHFGGDQGLVGIWRRKRDSNPRTSFPVNGFQDRRYQPLTHSSGILIIKR